jgi:hypothetical protein
MRLAMTGFAILLTSAIYLAVVQFHASVHASAGRLDANGNAAIAVVIYEVPVPG